MRQPYLILVDGRLFDRKLTKAGALRVVDMLQERGLPAVMAYEMENGQYENASK